MAKLNIFLRRRSVLAAAAAAIGLGGASAAVAQPDLVDFKVVDRETGQPLRVWRHHGRFFVAGEPGRKYALRVTNHTGGRLLVVMSVDGVNILSGETAGVDQRGYVFDPYQTWDLTGWRKSDSEVAAFVFAPLPKSYAARTGRPADVGVIGVAAFREKAAPLPPPPPVYSPPVSAQTTIRGGARAADSGDRFTPPPPSPLPGSAAPMAMPPAAPAARASRPVNEATVTGARLHRDDEKLGTGHGEREWSVVRTVEFERATNRPEMVQQIEYDTYDRLVAAGVIRAVDHPPRPFPMKPDGEGYVPDPPPEY
ncbi:MAG TPA: hypothetical protein VG407_16080 [Caulobacteraceae bacterium]|jgi:hypothetical protein|nr:hypothetical protein [Caulobacteraceae bacterium]